MDDIAPPPDSLYASYEEAYNALKSHGMQHGYGFVLNRSKPPNSDIKTRYYYHCDRFKKYQSKATILSTSTRTTGCPFKLVIFKIKDNDQWKLEVRDKHHNHAPSLNPSAHNVYRKRTSAQKDAIELMTHAGARPMQILAALQKEDQDTLVSATDIRGERKAIREKHLNGRTPIETLLDDLSKPEWVFAVKKDTDNRVQCLFFAHQKQIELLLSNPDILLMDCTYRTNKYKLPLLHILGCTNLQTFFSAGFCFLRNETQADYYWAISNFLLKTGTPEPRVFISDQEDALKLAARTLLPRVPQLLCVWHINKNVQTKAQQTWRDAGGVTKEEKQEIAEKRAEFMKRWTQVVYAKRPLEFQLKWDELLKDYSHQQELCEYLRENQYHTRTEWAAAWTSHYRHYNTTTTSPVEGMHKVLKDYLMTSRGDLLRVVGRIEQMIKNQYNKYRKEIASSKHSIKFKHKLELMPFLPAGIHNILTPPAIEHIRQQDLLRQKEQGQHRGRHPCSGLFEKTNGLPCRHTLQDLRNSGSTLLPNLYDDHWRYQREQGQSIRLSPRPHQSVLEPLPAQTRGAPRKNEASTRRDPSAFEQRVPPSIPQPQPLRQPQGQTLAEVLQHINTSVAVSVPAAAPAANPITTSVSVSVPAPTPISSPTPSHLSSPVSVNVSVTMAPSQQPAWQPPSLEEFLADIERRRLQPVLYNCGNMGAFANFLAETGQEEDRPELIEARHMALATSGLFASCTPTMAWNYHFGDKEAFYAERSAQTNTENTLIESQDVPRQRPKRAAAMTASGAKIRLSPRKRQRR